MNLYLMAVIKKFQFLMPSLTLDALAQYFQLVKKHTA